MKKHFMCLWNCLLLTFCLLLSEGCVVRHGHFTVASTKVFRLSNFELDKASRAKRVEGRDVMHIVCLFPTKGNATIEEAMDRALDQANGDIMTDVVIDSWGFYIPYIFGQQGWSVRGDVVKTRKN
jgi:hypothetical protein